MLMYLVKCKIKWYKGVQYFIAFKKYYNHRDKIDNTTTCCLFDFLKTYVYTFLFNVVMACILLVTKYVVMACILLVTK